MELESDNISFIGHGLAGIQGPMYWPTGTNCFHTRKVIYKLSPDHNITHWHKVNYFICLKEREIKIPAHTKSDSRPLPDYAPTTGYNLVFTDQYQFLMLSHGSLDELNSQLEEPLPVNHFRPRYPYLTKRMEFLGQSRMKH
ncbi:uncharacterized protein LOC135150288 [Daucus carota subsp. sativus]|uniref:uncharacterized protein LOC135150288 n=1 Tax=Daucus carota subsp. sativus TaxID=79200 RepID=UPI003082785F